jgi:hypothetical protein
LRFKNNDTHTMAAAVCAQHSTWQQQELYGSAAAGASLPMVMTVAATVR